MSRKRDLETNIRESYDLIHRYEIQIRESNDAKEQARTRRHIEQQKAFIHDYLTQYRNICTATGQAMHPAISEIEAMLNVAAHASPQHERSLDAVPSTSSVSPSLASPASASSAPHGGGDQINAQNSQGFINRPTAPVSQHFGNMVSNSPVIQGNNNSITSLDDISNVGGQIAVGSNIAQARDNSMASVSASPPAPQQRLSDVKLAKIIQTALQHYSVQDLLLALDNHATFPIDAATLEQNPAHSLVRLCRENTQKSALIESLLDIDEQLLGSIAEQQAWLQWARQQDAV